MNKVLKKIEDSIVSIDLAIRRMRVIQPSGCHFYVESWPKAYDSSDLSQWVNIVYWHGRLHGLEQLRATAKTGGDANGCKKAASVIHKAALKDIEEAAALATDREKNAEEIAAFLAVKFPESLTTGDQRNMDFSIDIGKVSPYFKGIADAMEEFMAPAA